MKLPKPVKVKVSSLVPYEMNPRAISEEGVTAVKDSIESYGYVQPIVVTKENVIVAGHTRYLALKESGAKDVEVYRIDMDEKEAQKFRLVDNRTHELSDWAHDKLVAEAREFDDALLEKYFPDMNLEVGQAKKDTVTDEDVELGALQAQTISEAPQVDMTEVHCPDCKGTFNVKTASLPIASFGVLD